MLLQRPRSSARLSLTPLIDVVFILLIFFMLESDFLRPYVMDLAHQSGGAQRPDSSYTPVLIELHADGTVWVNKVKRRFEDIKQVIYEFEANPKSPVVIAADKGVILQQAVDVIDVVQSLGFSNISMQEARQFE